jgi:HAD superfamily phosphatase (TIGR01668 family)
VDSVNNTLERETSAAETPAGADTAETEPQARRGLRIFCPHRIVDAVTDIDLQELWGRGIRGVILDLDNTLVRWRREEMTPEVVAWLQALKATGFQLAILSNAILSKRSERIAERFGGINIRRARKPRRSGFRRAMEAMGTTPATTAIVGDQMFTDIWGGNRVGIYTIMVKPIAPGEFLYTRYVSRPPERLLLRLFQKQGHL